MNRDAHVTAGLVASLLDLPAHGDDHAVGVPEIAGRLVGGYLGARGPDVIDPPTHPGHRGFGHAIVPALACAALIVNFAPGVRDELRGYVVRLRDREATHGLDMREHALIAACEFLIGLSVGLPAGYASHLALDAVTPAGLPWFKQGL